MTNNIDNSAPTAPMIDMGAALFGVNNGALLNSVREIAEQGQNQPLLDATTELEQHPTLDHAMEVIRQLVPIVRQGVRVPRVAQSTLISQSNEATRIKRTGQEMAGPKADNQAIISQDMLIEIFKKKGKTIPAQVRNDTPSPVEQHNDKDDYKVPLHNHEEIPCQPHQQPKKQQTIATHTHTGHHVKRPATKQPQKPVLPNHPVIKPSSSPVQQKPAALLPNEIIITMNPQPLVQPQNPLPVIPAILQPVVNNSANHNPLNTIPQVQAQVVQNNQAPNQPVLFPRIREVLGSERFELIATQLTAGRRDYLSALDQSLVDIAFNEEKQKDGLFNDILTAFMEIQ
jgi:hypothetical protein